MQLIAIQDEVMINPERISYIERHVGKGGQIILRVTVDGRSWEVTRPTGEFFDALNNYGVDLTKQYFAV